MGGYRLTNAEYRAMLERETGDSWADASDDAIEAVRDADEEETQSWLDALTPYVPDEPERMPSTEPCLSCVFHDCDSCGYEADSPHTERGNMTEQRTIKTTPATATRTLERWQSRGWRVVYVSPGWDVAIIERA